MRKMLSAFLLFALSFGSAANAQLSFTATTPALVVPIPNAASTGTTNGSLAKLTGAPSTAVITATTDTSGVIGVVVSGGGTTGNALIARSGEANCTFDGATTAGHYVINSANTAGDCEDSGAATYPTTGQVLGRVLSTNGSGGSYSMTIASDTLASSPSTPIMTTQGTGTTAYSYQLTGNAYFGANGGTGMFFGLFDNVSANKQLYIGDFDGINIDSIPCLSIAVSSTTLKLSGAGCKTGAAQPIGVGGTGAQTTLYTNAAYNLNNGNTFALLSTPANNTLHLGNFDAATAVAQVLGFQGVVAGTSNTAGANGTIAGSQGTGTGAGGSIIMQAAPAGSTGTAQNAEVTGLTIAPVGTVTAANVATTLQLAGNLVFSSTAPTITSGGCTSPAVTNSNGTAAFYITIGSSCSGSQPLVLALPAAPHGWTCRADDWTTPAQIHQTGTISTTAATLTDYPLAGGAAQAWTASDKVAGECMAF